MQNTCLYNLIKNFIAMTESQGGDVLEIWGRCSLGVMNPDEVIGLYHEANYQLLVLPYFGRP